ncbi:EAL domain-containing protein [Rhodovibrionaceae bacterium A322]
MQLKPIVLSIAAALVFGAGLLFGSYKYVTTLEDQEMEKRANFIVQRSISIMLELAIPKGEEDRGALAPETPGTCTEEDLNRLRYWVYASSFVGDVGLMSGDMLLCSALSGIRDVPYKLLPADRTLPDGMELRLNRELTYAPGSEVMVLNKDQWIMAMKPNFVDEFRYLDKNQYDLQLYFIGAEETPFVRIGKQIGAVEASWFYQDGVEWEKDNLYARKCTDDGRICALLHYPVDVIRANRADTMDWVAMINLISILAIGLAVYALYNKQTNLSTQLKRAIRNDELLLTYQPITSLKNSHCTGAEALMRWNNKGEWIRPDLFIEVAEQQGFIRDITQYLLKQAFAETAGILKARPDFRLTLNVTADDLKDHWLRHQLQDLIHLHEISAAQIGIELTERTLADVKEVSKLLQDLRTLGCIILIDDFGTGYSSLSYIRDLPFDVLKVDKSFVDTIGTDGVASGVLPHIIEMGHDLGVELVAEGVETAEQASWLAEQGTEKAQGWHYSKPLPLSDLQDYLKEEKARRTVSSAVA